MRTLRQSNVRFLSLRTLIALIFASSIATCMVALPSVAGPNDEHPTALACIKQLPDGTAVRIHQKAVIGFSTDYAYVEEADRSAGIRIEPGELYLPSYLNIGDLVSVPGIVRTMNGEKVVVAQTEVVCETGQGVVVGSFGMPTAAILGWPINPKEPHGPRFTGLLPTGQLVRIWGRVTTAGSFGGNWYVYLDDGWNKYDGLNQYRRSLGEQGFPGVMVFSSRTLEPGPTIVTATGVLSETLYDPTPQGIDGDEITVPVIRTTYPDDLRIAGTATSVRPRGPVSGRIRAIGRAQPGVKVRIYSELTSIVIDGVTDDWTSFTLEDVLDHAAVTASAAGYLSPTCVNDGRESLDLELLPSGVTAHVSANKYSIAVCSDDLAVVTASLHDDEGKGLKGYAVRLTTSSGVFRETNSTQVILTTDDRGQVSAELSSGSDGIGSAVVTAEDYPNLQALARITVSFRGPNITVQATPSLLSSPGSSVVTAYLSKNAVALPGAAITFSTKFGTFLQSGKQTYSTTTSQTGHAQATLAISSPGSATVLVRYTDECSIQTHNWVSVSYTSTPWFSEGVLRSNPLVVDLDGAPDGKKEVVVLSAAGNLVVINANGTELWSYGKYRTGATTPSCAVIDADRSNRPCIFLPVENDQAVHAFSHDLKPLAGWPARAKYPFYDLACAIGDINLDGSPEVVAGDESCFVFAWNTTGDWKGTGDVEGSPLWVNLTGNAGVVIRGSSCAIGDLDDDPMGMPDVLVGTASAPYGIYGFPGDAWGSHAYSGLYLPNWPKPTPGKVETSPAIGDIDGDGRNDAVWTSDDNAVHIWLSSTNVVNAYPLGSAIKSSPALCDLDNDGKLDIVIGSDSGRVHALKWNGTAPRGWGEGILLNATGQHPVQSSPTVGDVNGDGQIEVVVGCNDGLVYAIYRDGVEHEVNGVKTGPIAWTRCCVSPGQVSATIHASPVIDDLDNDGRVDVLVAGERGIYLFKFDAPYSGDPSHYPWPTFHKDNQRTGCATPPSPPVNASIQGIVTVNGVGIGGAKIYIYNADGSPVYQPGTGISLERSYVMSVGSTLPGAVGVGAYSINQLEPDRTYKLRVEAQGHQPMWIENVVVTTGRTRIDAAL